MAKELMLIGFMDLCTKSVAEEYDEIRIDLRNSEVKVYGTRKPLTELMKQQGYSFEKSGTKKI